MATIAEIRAKYPQYDDLSDTQLADSFRDKFYSDIPKEKFYAQLGIDGVSRGRPTMQNDPRIVKASDPTPTNEVNMDNSLGLSFDPKEMGSSYLGRAVQGLLDLPKGLLQLGSEAVGSKTVSDAVQRQEQQYEQGRAEAGSTGFDPMRLVGNVAQPLNYVIPAAGGSGVLRTAGTGAILAATQPVVSGGDEFWKDKGTQVAVGAIIGPLADLGVRGASALGKSLGTLTEKGKLQAVQDWLLKLSGKDKDVVIAALKDVPEIVTGSKPTALEALANVPAGANIAKAQQVIGEQQGTSAAMIARQMEQEAARKAQLSAIAGTDAERTALAAERSAVTGPMRETALNQSDVAGPIVTKLEREISNKFHSLAAAEQTSGSIGAAARVQQQAAATGKPGWLTAGDIAAEAGKTSKAYKDLAGQVRQEARLKQFQLDSLEQNGFFPLKAYDLTSSIDKAIKSTVSDQSKAVLQAVKDKIISKADENGIIGSRDLYENVRKMSNQDIAKLLGLNEQYASGGIPAQAAKALDSTKKLIDASLDKSSDGLWSKYLTTYKGYSDKLNRMEVGAALEQKLGTSLGNKERAGAFATAVTESASLIKKATGMPRFENINQVLTKEETSSVNKVLADLQRLEQGKSLASKTVLEGYEPKAPLEGVQLLSRSVSIAKLAMQALSRGNKADFEKKFLDVSLDPQAMAALMQAGPITGQRKLIEAINRNLSPEAQAVFRQSMGVSDTAREVGK